MTLSLDTHAFLWWLEDPQLLSKAARKAIGDGKNTVYVSAAVAWEIAIKRALGKLTFSPGFEAKGSSSDSAASWRASFWSASPSRSSGTATVSPSSFSSVTDPSFSSTNFALILNLPPWLAQARKVAPAAPSSSRGRHRLDLVGGERRRQHDAVPGELHLDPPGRREADDLGRVGLPGPGHRHLVADLEGPLLLGTRRRRTDRRA